MCILVEWSQNFGESWVPNYQTKRCEISKDLNFHPHKCGNEDFAYYLIYKRQPIGSNKCKPARTCSNPVFLNRRTAARYRALASIIPGLETPEETATHVCYKISLVQLITNLNIVLYLSTCHTVYISVLILFMIMP